jgi:hypothetical protein
MCKLCVAGGTMTQEQLDASGTSDQGVQMAEGLAQDVLDLIAGRADDPDGEAQNFMDQTLRDITEVVDQLWTATAGIVPPGSDPDAPAMVAARAVWVASRLVYDQKATALASSVVFLVRELETERLTTGQIGMEQAQATNDLATSLDQTEKALADRDDKLTALRSKIPSHLKTALGLDEHLWP